MTRGWVLVVFILVLGFAFSTGLSQFEYPPSTGNVIDFGTVVVNRTATAQYTFKVLESSDTAAQVTIYDPCSPFGLSGLASRSMVLQPGQSITFAVTFTPTQARSYACSFVIRASGGYPVQVTETVVQLSGQGLATSSPEPSGITVPGFPSAETVPGGDAQGLAGVTESDGTFQVAIAPATAIGGSLRECGGPPLGGQEFLLTPVGDGYGVAVPGYESVVAPPISRFSLFGMESVNLGDVCVEPVGQLDTVEPNACPCCSIVIEARMCCNPQDQFVETDTVYEPQLVRIRVAYCEPPDQFVGVDLTPLPLTNTGGTLVNPGLMPPAASTPDTSRIGVTSITLGDRVLFEGDGEFEQVVSAGSLPRGAHTVRAVVGRLNGEECLCEKTFEVLACPEVDAKLERTLDPEDGCAPVGVTYNLDWPGGKDDICNLWYCDNNDLPGSMQRISAFPTSGTYSTSNACTPRTVDPEVNVTANNCCRYDVSGEPFTVTPPFRMSEDCVCLRVLPNGVQVVLQPKVPASGQPACILCENYDVLIYWGDGILSDISSLEHDTATGEWTVTRPYPTDSAEDQRNRVNISLRISNPCGSMVKEFSSDCPFPDDLIPNGVLDAFRAIAGNITNPLEAALVVDSLFTVFDQVGNTQGETTICSVLLDMRITGMDMGVYSDFDKLVGGFRTGIAGGVFQRSSGGSETGPRKWRFYPAGATGNSSAKLVYTPGDRPYFELTILQGGCDDCPVLPTYRIVSTLTEVEAKRRVEEAREELESLSQASDPAFHSQTFSVTLEIGLCCPPDLCEE